MMNHFDQTGAFISEMKTLFGLKEKKFWNELFSEAKSKHTVQSDFYLVRKDIKPEDADEYLMEVNSGLCKKYNLFARPPLNDGTYKYGKYFYISFELNADKILYDFSTCVIPSTIKLDLLPMKLNIKTMPLEDYILAGNILSEICHLLFSPEEKRINRLLEEWNRIKSLSENLTVKTLEIAKNSIKAIYESHPEQCSHIMQRNLFTDLEVNRKNLRIYHKDFLENPKVLTAYLKR